MTRRAPSPFRAGETRLRSSLRNWASLPAKEPQPVNWVFSVAHCRLIDARRAKTRAHDKQPLDALSLHGDQERATAAAEDEALGRLATQRMRELLDELSPDQRDVLALRLLGQLSVQEVAVVLDKPPGAIKALQRRALATLRRRLGVRALGPVGTASA